MIERKSQPQKRARAHRDAVSFGGIRFVNDRIGHGWRKHAQLRDDVSESSFTTDLNRPVHGRLHLMQTPVIETQARIVFKQTRCIGITDNFSNVQLPNTRFPGTIQQVLELLTGVQKDFPRRGYQNLLRHQVAF